MPDVLSHPTQFELIAAPFTPFRPDFSVDVGQIAVQAERLIRDRADGAFVCGTTGEGSSLTVNERKIIVAEWVRYSADLKIIVHTGHSCIEEACSIARHANESGAHATSAMAPNFLRPADLEALVDYCACVAAAAPDRPFYYYHIPGMSGLDFAMHEFVKIAGDRIPNLAGIKFSHNDLHDLVEARQARSGGYEVYFGRDEMLLGALAMGATGAVGSTYNYATPVYREMIDQFNNGNHAEALRYQQLASRIISIFSRHGGHPANKAIMALAGVDCGPVRLPLKAITANQMDAMQAELWQLEISNDLIDFTDLSRRD